MSLAAIARGSVIVVDAAGGGQFTQIAPAIAAAQSGDTILVRSGTYSGFTVPDKSLSIVADDGAQVTVAGSAFITTLSASNTVVLAGLHVAQPGAGPSGTPLPALLVTNVAGAVRVQGCTLTGAPGSQANGGSDAGAGAEVSGGGLTRVAFVDCTLHGGNGGACDFCDRMPEGGPGIDVLVTRVALYDCTLVGGNGGYTVAGFSGTIFGGRGGDGARQYEGFVHASNSSLTGGNGGYVQDCALGQTIGGDGGDGLNLQGSNPPPAAWSIGSTFQPGAGSPHMGSGCNESLAGAPGQAVRVVTGSYFPLSGSKLEMDAPSIVREGGVLALTIRGEPGTLVDVVFAPATQFTAIPSWRGVVLTKNTPGTLHPTLYLGEIPASGMITDGITVGNLPAGVASGQFFLQARGRGPSGRVLGSFAALTVVDAAY
jgi:hypothetical protein